MAVEVIGEDEGVYKRISCRNCAAILRYVPADVKERHGRDYSGGSDGCEYIVCPKCSKQVVIKSW